MMIQDNISIIVSKKKYICNQCTELKRFITFLKHQWMMDLCVLRSVILKKLEERRKIQQVYLLCGILFTIRHFCRYD